MHLTLQSVTYQKKTENLSKVSLSSIIMSKTLVKIRGLIKNVPLYDVVYTSAQTINGIYL